MFIPTEINVTCPMESGKRRYNRGLFSLGRSSTNILHVRVQAIEYERLEEACKKIGVSKSDFIRSITRQVVNEVLAQHQEWEIGNESEGGRGEDVTTGSDTSRGS